MRDQRSTVNDYGRPISKEPPITPTPPPHCKHTVRGQQPTTTACQYNQSSPTPAPRPTDDSYLPGVSIGGAAVHKVFVLQLGQVSVRAGFVTNLKKKEKKREQRVLGFSRRRRCQAFFCGGQKSEGACEHAASAKRVGGEGARRRDEIAQMLHVLYTVMLDVR